MNPPFVQKLTPANSAVGGPQGPHWHSRGYLPHFESSHEIQHVTFHLADSLPHAVVRRLEEELSGVPANQRETERLKRAFAYIDAGHGSCLLKDSNAAKIAEAALLHFDHERYRLLAWVVMPNHIHTLIQPLNEWTISRIVATWKLRTAQEIWKHRIYGDDSEPGQIWQREYWDRFIRNERHFWKVVEYIELNPVAAGLVKKAEDWRWSSAGNRLGSANRRVGER